MGHSTNGRWGVDTIHKKHSTGRLYCPRGKHVWMRPKKYFKNDKKTRTRDERQKRTRAERNAAGTNYKYAALGLAHAVPPAPTMTTCACLSTTTTTTALPFEAVVLLQSHLVFTRGRWLLRNAFDGSSSPQPVLHPRRLLQPQA